MKRNSFNSGWAGKRMERGVPASLHFEPQSRVGKLYPLATAFPVADSGVSLDAAARAVVAAVGCVAAAVRVSGPTAASVAGAFVPLAAFWRRWPAAAPAGGDLAPASAQVSGDPAAASRTAFPVAAGISYRGLDPPCWVRSAAYEPAVRWNG